MSDSVVTGDFLSCGSKYCRSGSVVMLYWPLMRTAQYYPGTELLPNGIRVRIHCKKRLAIFLGTITV